MAKKSKDIEYKVNKDIRINWKRKISLDEIAEILGFNPKEIRNLELGNILYSNPEGNINFVYNPKTKKIIVPPYKPKERTDFHNPVYAMPLIVTSYDLITRQFTGSSNHNRRRNGYGSGRKGPYN